VPGVASGKVYLPFAFVIVNRKQVPVRWLVSLLSTRRSFLVSSALVGWDPSTLRESSHAMTGRPLTPGSPLSWMPSLSLSFQTLPLMVALCFLRWRPASTTSALSGVSCRLSDLPK
jgi:hypothetical protein